MVQRDRVTVVRQLGNVLPDVVRECQLAVLGQQQDRGGDELLRDRSDVHGRLRCQGHGLLEVRHPVRRVDQQLAVQRYRHLTPRRRRVEPAEHRRDPLRRVFPGRRADHDRARQNGAE
jgi:hypothetical protein